MGVPCYEVIEAARKSLREYNRRPVEAPPAKVLEAWLDRNQHLEIPLTSEAIQAALEANPTTAYQSMTVNLAANTADPETRAAIYNLVAEAQLKAQADFERSQKPDYLPTPKIVMQHPDSIRLFLQSMMGQIPTDWNMGGAVMTGAAGWLWFPAGVVAGVVTVGYQGWRWMQTQADPLVLKEMEDVAAGTRTLGPEQVLGIRVQTPTDEEFSLWMIQAPPLASLTKPEPTTGQRILGAFQRGIFRRAPVPPAQLHPTLVGFLHQGQNNDENPAAVTIP